MWKGLYLPLGNLLIKLTKKVVLHHVYVFPAKLKSLCPFCQDSIELQPCQMYYWFKCDVSEAITSLRSLVCSRLLLHVTVPCRAVKLKLIMTV